MDNSKISHRQLRREIVLAYLAPVLLCLPGIAKIRGMQGMLSVTISLLVMAILVYIFQRISFPLQHLKKSIGTFWGRVAGLFFLFYILLTAAYLLAVLMDVLPRGIISDVPAWMISLLAVIACVLGTGKGIQSQGRLAGFTGGVCTIIAIIWLVISTQNGNLDYLKTMQRESGIFWPELRKDWYRSFCFFSGLLLIPFGLQYLENRSSGTRPIVLSIGILFLFTLAILFILPLVLGWNRSQMERYPILPLLKSANIPGDILARFDMLWILFLLFALLFSIGTLFFYGNQILNSAGIESNGWLLGGIACFLSWNVIPKWDLELFYPNYVAYVFVPGSLICYVILLFHKKSKKNKMVMHAGLLMISFFLCGCGGVEPENRLYPLAFAIDRQEDGTWKAMYCMENLSSETGEDKAEEDGFESVLTLKGNNFAEIMQSYQWSQEKYLDLGHLEVVILGTKVLEQNAYDEVLEYLQGQPVIGEDIYVFSADNPKEIVNYEKAKQSSIGEYIKGIYENRQDKKTGVTIRQILADWYQEEKLPKLPKILYNGGSLLFVV